MAIEVRITAAYEEFVSRTQEVKQLFSGVMDGMRAELKSMSDQAKVDFKSHESASEQFANVTKNSFKGVNGVVEGVKTAWAQLAVVIGAGMFLKSAVDDTMKWTTESQHLGSALGISATQASYLKVALQMAGSTTDEYTALSKGLTTQLATHEAAMNKAGLATRDAGGNLKEQQTLVQDALETLRGYKEGTDRNVAAQQLFGQGVKVTNELMSLNAKSMAEAKEFADQLGLAMGKDNVEASEALKGAMSKVELAFNALKIMIGEALLPVLKDFGQWVVQFAPNIMAGLGAAIASISTLFKGLALAIRVAWEVGKLTFESLIDGAGAFGSVFSALMRGDFAAAQAAAQDFASSSQQNVASAFSNILAAATSTGESITSMWKNLIDGSPVVDSGTEGGGDKGATPQAANPDGAAAAAARRAAAEEKRLLKEKYDAVMEGYRGEEQAAKGHFDLILEIQRKELAAAIAMYGEKSKQAEAVANRIAETERQAAEQQRKLDDMRAESTRQLALDRIDVEQAHAAATEQVGDTLHQHLLTQELGFEQRRYEIQKQGLIEEAISNKDRILDHEATLLKLDELESAHQGRVGQLQSQALQNYRDRQEQQAQFLGNAFAQSAQVMIDRTMSLKQALGQIFTQMAQAFIQQESLKLARYVVGQASMTGANLAGNAIRTAADVASAKTSVAANAGAAIKNIINKAAEVFANVWAAISSIPYVGPFIAPALAIAATGVVIGAVSRVASAEGGYDIPAGVNPLTQLHEKEMVLPQRQADAVRDMADNGGAGGGAPIFNINLQAMDKRGVASFFHDNAATIGAALQQHYANR